MRIREDVLTRATPAQAWELVRDPELHELWNPRIVETEAISPPPPGLGSRYRVSYELGGRRSMFDAEIVEFEAPLRFCARLTERFQGDGRNSNRVFEERYTLTARGERTHVRHDVLIQQSGVHPLLRFLVWFIMKTGKPVGRPFMDRFRELAESPSPRS